MSRNRIATNQTTLKVQRTLQIRDCPPPRSIYEVVSNLPKDRHGIFAPINIKSQTDFRFIRFRAIVDNPCTAFFEFKGNVHQVSHGPIAQNLACQAARRKQGTLHPPAPSSFPPNAPAAIPFSYNSSMLFVDTADPVCLFNLHVWSSKRPNSSKSECLSVRTFSASSTKDSISFNWAVLSVLLCEFAFCTSEEKRVNPVKNIKRFLLSCFFLAGEIITGRTS